MSNIATYPLDLIITRLQIQRQVHKSSSVQESERYTSVQDAVHKIYQQEGLGGFFTGAVQDTLKSSVDSFLFFLVYNSLREARLKSRQKRQHLPALDELGVGFIAGATARFCTMPVSAVVTRMQTTSMVTSRSSGMKGETPSVSSIAKQIRVEKGIQGFWSGYSATLVLTLNPSLTFFFFENLKRALLPQAKRSDPGPTITFFIAALSKVMASSITYPFSLAKARMQVSSKSDREHSNEGEHIYDEKQQTSKSLRSKKVGRNALNRTIFGKILDIAQEEGIGSLYEGLQGEVLKGFFSHGITMLMKDAAHSLIVRLYFLLLRLLSRYPGAEDLARITKERAQDALEFVENQRLKIAKTAGAAATGAERALVGKD